MGHRVIRPLSKAHPLLNFAKTQPRWLKAWIPTLGPTRHFLSHCGCPFGVVNQESSLSSRFSPGRAPTDARKAKVDFCMKDSPPPFRFLRSRCLTPPVWLRSRRAALPVFECHITGIVASREMPFFVSLSAPVLSSACALALPLYKGAEQFLNMFVPVVFKHVCPWNAVWELLFPWETTRGQWRPRRSPAGHVMGGQGAAGTGGRDLGAVTFWRTSWAWTLGATSTPHVILATVT